MSKTYQYIYKVSLVAAFGSGICRIIEGPKEYPDFISYCSVGISYVQCFLFHFCSPVAATM